LGVIHPPSIRFQRVVKQLVEGDLSLFAEISQDVAFVPSSVVAGDLFVASNGTASCNWYEVIEPALDDLVFVRLFSWAFRQGEYDHVELDHLAARVTRRLFERARANGFRSVRLFN
jgi:hypothetical protein